MVLVLSFLHLVTRVASRAALSEVLFPNKHVDPPLEFHEVVGSAALWLVHYGMSLPCLVRYNRQGTQDDNVSHTHCLSAISKWETIPCAGELVALHETVENIGGPCSVHRWEDLGSCKGHSYLKGVQRSRLSSQPSRIVCHVVFIVPRLQRHKVSA